MQINHSIKIYRKLQGLTLVEILIVIVIIGVLSAATIPKLQGIQARARDVQRQHDIDNLAIAIQLYKNDNGILPFSNGGFLNPSHNDYYLNFRRSAQDLDDALSSYMTPIPKDPNSNHYIDLCPYKTSNSLSRFHCNKSVQTGEYLYIIYRISNSLYPFSTGQIGSAIIAKMENPQYANFVLVSQDFPFKQAHTPGYAIGYGMWNGREKKLYPWWVGTQINLCDTIVKGKKNDKPSRILQKNGTYHCVYTDKNQLYYIHTVK